MQLASHCGWLQNCPLPPLIPEIPNMCRPVLVVAMMVMADWDVHIHYITNHMRGPRKQTMRLRGALKESRALVVLVDERIDEAGAGLPFTALLLLAVVVAVGFLRRGRRRPRTTSFDDGRAVVKIEVCDTRETVVTTNKGGSTTCRAPRWRRSSVLN